MKPRTTHTLWQCPKCGVKYRSPVPATDAICERKPAHGMQRFHMKPVEEDEDET